MDEIGSYIKYILIAVFLAFRFFAGSKKKEQKPQKRRKPRKTNTPTGTTSLEDILKELRGETTQTTPAPTPSKKVSSEKTRERKKIEIEDHQYDFRPEYEHHADTDMNLADVRREIRENQGLEIQEEEASTAMQSGFDLKQAIIAETILNRPRHFE